jgi:hypothetical protein
VEINLSPLDNPRWSDIQKITDLVDSFLRNGFEATERIIEATVQEAGQP